MHREEEEMGGITAALKTLSNAGKTDDDDARRLDALRSRRQRQA